MVPDPELKSGTGFEHDFWRSAPVVEGDLPRLESGDLDDSQFRLLADHIPTLCWIANGDGYIVWYNRRWHEYCGTTPEEMEGWGWQSVHDPELLPQVMERWTNSVASGEPFEMTFPLRGADGIFRPFLTRVQPIRDSSGAVVRWIGTNTEITAQSEIELALRRSEQRLQLVQSAGRVGSFDYDLTREIAVCSDEYYEIIGVAPQEKISLDFAKTLIHPDDLAESLAILDRCVEQKQPFEHEYRIIRPDSGEVRWVANNATLILDDAGVPWRYIGGLRDITDRKLAEIALKTSENQLRAVLDAAPGGFYCVNCEGNTTLVSRGFIKMMGFASERDVLGQKLHDLIHHTHPDGSHYPVEECPIYQCASTGKSAHVPDELFFKPDGTAVAVEYWVSSISLDGERIGAICTILDISERKATEAALRETEERYRLASRATNDAIWDWDLVNDVVQWNEALLTVFGHSADMVQPTGQWWLEQVHPDDRQRVSDSIHALIDSDGSHWTDEYRFRTASDEYRDVFDRGFVLRDSEGRALRMIGAMLDQTDRRRAEARLRELNETLEIRVNEEIERRSVAEEALRQSQKMETLGQLTGGIAHDFNNLLQVVAGNLDMLKRSLGEDQGRLMRLAENAMTGATRAATLTQRLLAFSRRQPLEPKPIDANRLLAGMADILFRTLGETIEVETVLAPRLWPVEADPNQLENAIINLAVNARDAMPDGGKLTIETTNTYLDRSYTALHPEIQEGQYVVICISDTGVGMSSDIVNRAMEPFFTTKEVGRGTGLGLSMVYGFVKQSGGHVKIYSEPGEGTTIKVYLPRLHGAVAEVEDQATTSAAAEHGDETILVCEDDDDVRAFSVQVLRERGYRVLEAHDGPSALRLLQRQEGGIDLLFTDVVLPGGMSGADLARAALDIQPGLKTLFTTGYARNAIVHHGRLDPGVELITKPFSYDALAERVRQLLDGS